MTPRTPDQWIKIGHEKFQIILDTALVLFAQRGYHEISISLIAKEDGNSKGLIYNYFENINNPFNKIISLGMDELIKDFEMEGDEFFTKEKMGRYILKLQGNPKFYQLFFLVIIQPRILNVFPDKFFTQIIQLLSFLEKYYKAKGNKSPKVNAYLFMVVLDGVGVDFIANRENFPLAETKNVLLIICSHKNLYHETIRPFISENTGIFSYIFLFFLCCTVTRAYRQRDR